MAVLLRAIVMLVVLVGLPAAWVYYGPLPPGAQQAVDRVIEIVKETTGWQQTTGRPEQPKAAPRYQTAIEPAPAFMAPVANQPVTISAESTLSERAEPLLEQLRSLGASQYTLEKWGQAGELFRFRCAMPLVKNQQFTQQFEAVANSPLDSIEQVVVEVAHWQTARHVNH